MTVDEHLDRAEEILHGDEVLWPRAELIRAFNDGLRELLSLSHAVRRWRALDIPGRHTYGMTYEWEDRHAAGGTVRKPSRALLAGWAQGTARWEAQHLAGVTPSSALAGIVQDWERSFVTTDRHYRFVLPKNHERIARVMWDNYLLVPVSVRELDETDDRWPARTGRPSWWTTGQGRITTFEVYEIETEYRQAYALLEASAGLPRQISGSRTYAYARSGPVVAPNYAYTNGGDADALTMRDTPFVPATAYCHSWESSYGVAPRYNFTINMTQMADITRVAVHPWEIPQLGLASDAATPGQRGMFPWERRGTAGEYESQTYQPTTRPAFSGFGVRITALQGQSFCTQAWEAEVLASATAFTTGVVRASYSWEADHGATLTIAVGTARSVSSTERQYLAGQDDAGPAQLLGALRDWRSSDDSVLVLEVIIPSTDMGEPDEPGLIPEPLGKYLRWYVMAKAFARSGEGKSSILADHYQRRFLRGVLLMKRLADVAGRDRVYRREAVTPPTRRIARVSLPSEFPAVW